MCIFCTGAADVVMFDSLEIHTPIHNHRTKQPISIDHLMPFQHGGVDKRNLTPFNPDFLPKAQVEHIQGLLLASGGWVDIEAVVGRP